MKLCTISHSHIALRQQLFFQEVARQGHEVLMIAPGEWGLHKAKSYQQGSFTFKTCRHMGENIYNYTLLGARPLVEEFDPDWLYMQVEPSSEIAKLYTSWPKKKALFTWENINLSQAALSCLPAYDLVVCGNKAAEDLVLPVNTNTKLLLQVGIDTDHFQARPAVPRDVLVGYIGRRTPEKGLPYLLEAWPMANIMDWADYNELPWRYSQVRVIVSYSIDTMHWHEQAPNYVVLEALSCGCKAVTSTTAAMKSWLEGCPGVIAVPHHDQLQHGAMIDLDKVVRLNKAINETLEMDVGDEARQWVIDRFSSPVVARELIGALSERT